MNIPSVGSYWRNPRSGKRYKVVLISNRHADEDRKEDYPIIVNYRGLDKKSWAVTLEHWERKAFQPLSPSRGD